MGKLCDCGVCCWSVVTYRPVGTLHLDIRSTGGFPVEGESSLGSASRGRYKKGEIMTISKERKAELTAKFGKNAQDTGNSKVQVAILSERIKELTEHMKSHQKDFHTRRGLLMLVGKRRRLLSYIKKNDINEYRELIAELGIRDNIQ